MPAARDPTQRHPAASRRCPEKKSLAVGQTAELGLAMKKRSIALGFGISLILLLVVFLSFTASDVIERRNAVLGLSVLRQLHQSIWSYHQDGVSERRDLPTKFPKTLDDLVRFNYFPGDALKKYRKAYDIQYHPPPENPAPEYILLEIQKKKYNIWINYGGDGSIKK